VKFNKKYFIYLGVVAVLVIGIFSINFLSNDKQEINSNISFVDDSVETTTEDINSFYVDIKGAVKKPGVYKVSENMIVNDLIKLAGGLNKNAYTKNINLASKLKEGMVVYVYSKNEMTTTKILNDVKYEVPSSNEETTTVTNGKVNINTASKEELMTLSGVGESKAIAIIDYRSKNRFNTIEDIMNVSGIGESAFVKIKEYITV
jgi:competence protein ComEA